MSKLPNHNSEIGHMYSSLYLHKVSSFLKAFYIKTTCDLYINISLLSKRFQQLNTMLLNKCTSTQSNLITIVLTYCIISIVFEVAPSTFCTLIKHYFPFIKHYVKIKIHKSVFIIILKYEKGVIIAQDPSMNTCATVPAQIGLLQAPACNSAGIRWYIFSFGIPQG
jgi:hypothetical protein